MTEKEKDLLIKDLCARLPYGVIIQIKDWTVLDAELKIGHINRLQISDVELKPYLFPLSSMTEEQEDEWYEVFVDPLSKKLDRHTRQEGLQLQADAQAFGIEYLLKNHFDYRGLIEKGLAIDATGLNIY